MQPANKAHLAIVSKALEVTTPRSRQVLKLYFTSKTATEAAALAGISRRTLAQHVRRFEFATGLRAKDAAPLVQALVDDTAA